MIKILPFGSFLGFSDTPRPGSSFYTQGLTQSFLGAANLYSIVKKISSDDVSSMGNVKTFASANGVLYAQDDAGHVLAEGTPGAYDFSIVRNPGGNGAGLIGDQKGRLLYAQNTQIGMYNGSAWTDNWKTGFTAGQHPMDTYEDGVYIGNVTSLALIASDDSVNLNAFTLPSGFSLDAVRSGPNGLLMGANFGYQGAIILWDGTTDRAKAPWKWTKGKIVAIERYGQNWIVQTQREFLLTNGYSVKRLFGVFDDPMSFKGYETVNVLTQRILLINDTLVILNPSRNTQQSYEFGRMKPGLYLFHIPSRTFDYIPVHTGNTASLQMNAVFADVNYTNRVLVSYRDTKLAKNYISTLANTGASSAIHVSEVLGMGRPHYQRVYFGPTEKVPEAVILNLSVLDAATDPQTLTFNCALKIYDFKRPLWGRQITNAAASAGNKIRVDGTDATYTKAHVGDEVTVLEGANAGLIAHISSIANAGTNTETWTLDTTFANNTENNINLNVQPFQLIEKKAFSTLSSLKDIYFNIEGKKGIRGKQFLAKIVLDGMSNVQLQLQTSYFIFDDLGHDAP